jgi:protein TonB
MFEDSTFESTGRIRTRSRGWMVATFLLNGSILMGLILIPLIHPEALMRQGPSFLLATPPPPPTDTPMTKQPKRTMHDAPEMQGPHVFLPPLIPATIRRSEGSEEPPSGAISLNAGGDMPGMGVFDGHRTPVVVHPEVGERPVRLSSGIVTGLLIYKVTPQYPEIAKAAGVGGTVVLQATIAKDGTIENLRVAGGPAMLQQAAIDAVKTWRYRPYLLNNVPVEVETTVSVVFTLGR